MGVLLALLFLSASGSDEVDEDKRPMLYRPPQAAPVVPVEASRLNSHHHGNAAVVAAHKSVCPLVPSPPSCFKRLDSYIHVNDLRAWDVFAAMDVNNNKRITLEELLDGFHQINFHVSSTDQADLVEWMHDAVEADGLSFKEFALALKLRSSLASPHRAKQRPSKATVST
ncbi:hypothetical protein DYB32_000990 [Aphanomyces invadans]|uniref:EF-hand domain-containing protein n=1 Tax=Aphanomyces invadans TaxID=157072 RepID=A0A418B838_9STRA|nr:hypothetical protein DYB32_000990 [Aphanomyces invadans]